MTEASGKLRLVLDYLPCEACLEIPVDDQELHCSICRRLSRVVAVRTASDVSVVVEAPPEPVPVAVEVPPAAARVPPEAVAEGFEAPPGAAAPLASEAEADAESDAEDAPEPEFAAEPDDEPDVAFGTSEGGEFDEDVGFARTEDAEEEVAWSPAAAEADEAETAPQGEPPSFTFDPESLDPDEDEASLAREAEAWAERALEEEEVELEPVRPDEPLAAVEEDAPPAPEPDDWPAEPQAETLEVLEVVEEEPAQYEVLEVLEEEPVDAEADDWQDDAWPEDAPTEAPPAPAPPALAEPAPEDEEAWADPAEPPEGPAPHDPLTSLEGLGSMYESRLLAQGIQRVGDLAGEDPFDLAYRTGIAEKLVRRWVSSADLAAAGVPLAYAEVLVRAGYETPEQLAGASATKVVEDVNRALERGEGRGAVGPVDEATVRAWQER